MYLTCFRAASTTNVMFASAPLTRPASALQLDSDIDNSRGILDQLHDLIIVYHNYFHIIKKISRSMLQTKDA